MRIAGKLFSNKRITEWIVEDYDVWDWLCGIGDSHVFAEMGNDVLCIDIDKAKVKALQAGEVPIFEPGLEQMVRSNTQAGRISLSLDAEAGVHHGEVIVIAVGTPADEDGSADLSHVLDVASTIGEHMREPKVIVDKSTVLWVPRIRFARRLPGLLQSVAWRSPSTSSPIRNFSKKARSSVIS